jgi:hypothetical protein
VSKRTESKRARRDKRRAARDANWIPDTLLDAIVEDAEVVEGLESIDSRVVERGWVFDDDQSDEEFVIWFYPPSGAEVGEGMEPVTTMWMHAPENAEIVHLTLVGTAGDQQMTPDEFFQRIDEIEGHRYEG